MPHKGSLVISASNSRGDVAHLEAYIDGKKTSCATSPCIEEVSVGSHSVKVVAEGYGVIPEQTVTVDSKQQARASFALTSAGEAGTGFKVAGSQPNARLYVDDKESRRAPRRGARSGARQPQDPRRRWRPLPAAREEPSRSPRTRFQDLGTITLKVVKGKATITPGTPGAKVYIVSGADRRELPTLPISVDIDTSKPWSLVASKIGYQRLQPAHQLRRRAGREDVHRSPSIRGRRLPPPPPATRRRPRAGAPAACARRGAGRDARPRPRPPPPRRTRRRGGGEAFLNINSIPASSIVLDGKPIGNTPKLRYSVSPGSHTVLFVNTEQGLKKIVTVSVGAGETKPAIGKGE